MLLRGIVRQQDCKLASVNTSCLRVAEEMKEATRGAIARAAAFRFCTNPRCHALIDCKKAPRLCIRRSEEKKAELGTEDIVDEYVEREILRSRCDVR